MHRRHGARDDCGLTRIPPFTRPEHQLDGGAVLVHPVGPGPSVRRHPGFRSEQVRERVFEVLHLGVQSLACRRPELGEDLLDAHGGERAGPTLPAGGEAAELIEQPFDLSTLHPAVGGTGLLVGSEVDVSA